MQQPGPHWREPLWSTRLASFFPGSTSGGGRKGILHDASADVGRIGIIAPFGDFNAKPIHFGGAFGRVLAEGMRDPPRPPRNLGLIRAGAGRSAACFLPSGAF